MAGGGLVCECGLAEGSFGFAGAEHAVVGEASLRRKRGRKPRGRRQREDSKGSRARGGADLREALLEHYLPSLRPFLSAGQQAPMIEAPTLQRYQRVHLDERVRL